jgi:hypothetical protein
MGEPVVSMAWEARPEFEKERRYQGFLNRLYAARGYTVQRVSGRANRDYDLLLQGIPTEEKSVHNGKAEVAFEVLQDVARLAKAKWDAHGSTAVVPLTAIGNQFITRARQQVWYIESESNPVAVWMLDSHGLRDWYLVPDNFHKCRLYTVVKGFGLTICAAIPLPQLKLAGIAEQWWALGDSVPTGEDVDPWAWD